MSKVVWWVGGIIVSCALASIPVRCAAPEIEPQTINTIDTDTQTGPAMPEAALENNTAENASPVAAVPSMAELSEQLSPSPMQSAEQSVLASETAAAHVATPQVASEEAVQPLMAEQPAGQPQPALSADEIMGIDTVDLENPQGNWLYKRVWWEKAEAKFEKIRAAVNKILEMRTGFFAKRAELDKTVLDPFYIKIGLSQGELQEILAELIAHATAKTEEKKEDTVIEQANAEKQELEQLQKEVQLVIKQDSELEDAVMMLLEQINKIRRLEQTAWQNFKDIARVLDDKKARELYYKVDNAWRNVQELQNYIEQTYSTTFEQLVEHIKEKIQKVEAAIETLKVKGVDLKKQLQAQEIAAEDEETTTSKGFFTRYISDPIKNFFAAFWQLLRWPIDKIFGKTSMNQEKEPIEAVEPTSSAAQEEEETAAA
jgi:hypothetical protein